MRQSRALREEQRLPELIGESSQHHPSHRELSKSASSCFGVFFFAGPGVFLASHFFPGLLPAGFQDGVVGVPRVLLRQQGDVERPQQPRGPERAERKSKSLLSAQFSPGWRDQSWFLSLRAAASCPPSIPSRIEGDRGHEGAVITGRNLKSQISASRGPWISQPRPSGHWEGERLHFPPGISFPSHLSGCLFPTPL